MLSPFKVVGNYIIDLHPQGIRLYPQLHGYVSVDPLRIAPTGKNLPQQSWTDFLKVPNHPIPAYRVVSESVSAHT